METIVFLIVAIVFCWIADSKPDMSWVDDEGYPAPTPELPAAKIIKEHND